MVNVPIFLSADNNYAPFVATTIASICDNTKSFCHFYVLDGGITQENQEKICELKNQFNNFSIEFINIQKHIANFTPNKFYNSQTMFARFLIPELKTKINKAIYTDADVIFLDDIQKYYDENLDDYIIGCVQAPFIDTYSNNLEVFNFSKEHVYFCSGNLLINCEKWRKNNILEKILNVYDIYQQNLISPDQDILNKVFDNNYKALNKKYCVTEFHLDFYGNIEDVFIRHFGTTVKPWQINPETICKYPDLHLFWKYAKKTSFSEILLDKTKDQKIQKDLCMKIHFNKILRKQLCKKR